MCRLLNCRYIDSPRVLAGAFLSMNYRVMTLESDPIWVNEATSTQVTYVNYSRQHGNRYVGQDNLIGSYTSADPVCAELREVFRDAAAYKLSGTEALAYTVRRQPREDISLAWRQHEVPVFVSWLIGTTIGRIRSRAI